MSVSFVWDVVHLRDGYAATPKIAVTPKRQKNKRQHRGNPQYAKAGPKRLTWHWFWGLGFWGSGFWVLGSGFWVLGSGFWVLGSGVHS